MDEPGTNGDTLGRIVFTAESISSRMIGRRRVLRALSASAALASAGCFAVEGTDRSDGSPDETVRRGEADAVARYETTIQDDDVDYVGNGTVEIVVAQSGGDPVRTETEPFEEWAERRCLTAAQAGVWRHVKDEIGDDYDLDTSNFRFGHGAEAGAPRSNGVIVTYLVTLDHDDNVVDQPSIPFDELVDVTPESATATIKFEGQEHHCEGPVWVERRTEYEAGLA